MKNAVTYMGTNDGYSGNVTIRIDREVMVQNQDEKMDRAELMFKEDEYAESAAKVLNGKRDMTGHQLVDGAILSCNRAMLPTGEKVNQNKKAEDDAEKKDAEKKVKIEAEVLVRMRRLFVPEDRRAKINGERLGKLTDTIGGKKGKMKHLDAEGTELNIYSFGNCMGLEKRYEPKEGEEEEIERWGDCYCAMDLSSKWEDLSMLAEGDSSEPIDYDGEGATLTMMSALYCNQGGMIVPETSGQISQLPTRSMLYKLWNDLHMLGYSDIAVAALLGNICTESGFQLNPGDGDPAGLIQWLDVRLTALDAYAKSINMDWRTSYETQLGFFLQETNGAYKKFVSPEVLNEYTDLDKATERVQNTYEGAPGQKTNERKGFAKAIYDFFINGKLDKRAEDDNGETTLWNKLGGRL